MITRAFENLCSEYSNLVDLIELLESVPPEYQQQPEDSYALDALRRRETKLRGQMKAHLEQPR